jgi:DNA polymerase III subunit chi
MTRVDFYLVDSEDANLAACKLANKAFSLGHRVFILATSAETAARLDQLLWTFHPGSFVPHELHSNNRTPATPVLIGHEPPPADCEDVLINLADQVPDCFSRFQRVAEIVGAAAGEKERARERFRFYRDRGYTLQTHNL